MLLRLAALFAAFAATPQDDAVFHSAVSLVHVDAEVLQDNRTLDSFHKSDFRVLDNGKEQTIVNFSAEEQPLDLILLFDISGSMRPLVAQVAAAGREGLREMRPGDRVAVMVFNTRSRLVKDFTENMDAVGDAIERDVMGLEFGGGTYIQDAVDDAALRLKRERRTERRRAVLIITDNYGRTTKNDENVSRDFWEADALLSGLIVRTSETQTMHTLGAIMSPTSMLLEHGMSGIATNTGGDVIKTDEPSTAFRDMMRRIRMRYGLYYNLPDSKPGKEHTIKVELTKEVAARYPKFQIRARKGYVTPQPPKH